MAKTAAESVVAEKRRLEQRSVEQRSVEQSGGNVGKEQQPATVPTNRFRIHHSDILERLLRCGIALPTNQTHVTGKEFFLPN